MAKKQKQNKGLLTAQELAEESGESYDTIDHWAGEKVLPYLRRGRTRYFPASDSVALCRRIRELQNEDYDLAAIRRELAGGR